MGKIYSVPSDVTVPEFNWEDIDGYKKAVETFEIELREWCKKRNNKDYVGEIISFPVADNYASYMVASLSPIELIHIPTWDGYHFEYAARLTKKDIIEKINQQNAMKKLFGGKQK